MRYFLKSFVLFFLCVSLLFGANFEEEFSKEYPTTTQSADPLKPYNKLMTNINDVLYTYAFTPLAQGYNHIVADEIKTSVSNVFNNLLFPINFINNLLQLKVENSLEELGRFVINSTLGIGGIFDVARSQFELQAHKEDFGQTLGHYGVTNDIHFVLPLLGPSNVRDIVGLSVDAFADPLSYVNHSMAYKAYRGFHGYSDTYTLYEKLKSESIDLYSVLKSVYEQNRDAKIKE